MDEVEAYRLEQWTADWVVTITWVEGMGGDVLDKQMNSTSSTSGHHILPSSPHPESLPCPTSRSTSSIPHPCHPPTNHQAHPQHMLRHRKLGMRSFIGMSRIRQSLKLQQQCFAVSRAL